MNIVNNNPCSYNFQFAETLLLKKKLFRQVEGEVKKYLNLYYSSKESQLRIWQHFPKQLKKNEEVVHKENIQEFLMDQSYSFFLHSQRGDFESALFQLKKIQKVIHFFRSHSKEKSFLMKEQWISHINEIVYLREHGLLAESSEVHNFLLKMFKEVKANSSLLSNPAIIASPQLLDQLRFMLERDKLKLRVLLSLSIGNSDLGFHKKAVSTSQRALKCIVNILLQTKVIAQCYLMREL